MLTQKNVLVFFPEFVPTFRGTIVFVVLCVLVLMSVLVSDGQTPATLAEFNNTSLGGHANASLIQATDGNFYGTTLGGGGDAGAAGHGTAFRLSPAGSMATLHAFTGGDDGAAPTALAQAADGNLYGATTTGGAGGRGTLFRLSPDGTLTTLHAFSGGADGATPNALTASSDGHLYGTTSAGGAGGYGTVFRLLTDGTLTTLHAFSGGADGATPLAALVQGTDDSLYGTTGYGGSAAGYDGSGTVFGVTKDGTLTTLYAFSGTDDGSYPFAPLIQGSDGRFYGTTSGSAGGANSGTAFVVTTYGGFATLHAFSDAADGSGPAGGLVQDGSGLLYGTTRTGGYGSGTARADGTLFALTTDGGLTTLHTFNGATGEGHNPASSLVLSGDGTLYGTTVNGGASDAGTVFTLAATAISPVPTPDPAPPAPTVDVFPGGSGALAADVTVGKIDFVRNNDDLSAPMRVHYRLGGTAENGTDYVGADGAPLSGVVVIPAGKSRKRVLVYATHTMPHDRRIRFMVTNPANGSYQRGETPAAILLITTAAP